MITNESIADARRRLQARPGVQTSPEAVVASELVDAANDEALDAAATDTASTATSTVNLVTQLEAIGEAAAQQRKESATAGASTAQLMAGLGVLLDCRQDQHGGFFVLHRGAGRPEHVPLLSERYKDLVRVRATQIGGYATSVPTEKMNTIISIARNSALQRPPERVYRRVGRDGDDYLFDLGSDLVVRITPQGFSIEQNDRYPFRQSREQAVMVPPIPCDNAVEAFLRLGPLLAGVPGKDQVKFLAVLVEYHRTNTPYPILQLTGPEGSSKSAVAEHVLRVVDDFVADEPPSTGLELEDITASAQHRHAILLDNASELGKGVENMMCIMSLGGTQTSRLLYTNSEQHVAVLHNPLVITAIRPVIRQADTLDRTLSIAVERPQTYVPMSQVRREFRARLPEIQGGLLFFLSTALRMRDEVAQTPGIGGHRMVDWLMTGEAIARSLGVAPGRFLRQMQRSRRAAARDYIEGDLFASALVRLIDTWVATAVKRHQTQEALPSWRTWSSTPGWCVVATETGHRVAATPQAILKELTQHVEGVTNTLYDQRIPRTARAVTSALQRVQGVLGRAGTACERQTVNGGSNAYWIFDRPGDRP